MSFAHPTTDHEEIKAWAKEHNLKPAIIATTGLPSEKKGLRFDAPGEADEAQLTEAKQTQDVSWAEFFQVFEEEGLALSFDEEFTDPTAGYQFVPRRSLGSEA